MGPVAKTLAVAGTLTAGYVALRYFTSKKSKETAQPSPAAPPSSPAAPPSSPAAPTHLPIAGYSVGMRSPWSKPAESSSMPTTPSPITSPSPPVPEPEPRPSAPSPKPQASPPSAPLPEPHHPKLRQRINRTVQDGSMTVRESPDELLRQARRFDPTITLDELTGARLAASEHYSGTFTELCCIVDAELNRANRRRMSLFESLTHRGTFGSQGQDRRATTRRDPQMRHLLAARAVLSGQHRGIARGAMQFFDPVGQLSAHRKWLRGESDRKHCPPLAVLEKWAFGVDWTKVKRSCTPDRSKPGKYRLEWVGPIPGVNAMRLMPMRPATDRHQEMYEAARKLISDRLGPAVA